MIEILDLNHVTLIVRDIEAARRFYGDALGMTEVTPKNTFKHSTHWFRKNNAEVHLIQVHDGAQTPGDPTANMYGDKDHSRARHLAFAVKDTDEVVRAFNQRGIPIVLGPRPRGDGATQMFCYDPDGHLVELHTLP